MNTLIKFIGLLMGLVAIILSNYFVHVIDRTLAIYLVLIGVFLHVVLAPYFKD